MTSHELAHLLLVNDDMPVITFANNHSMSDFGDKQIEVGITGRDHILIGNWCQWNIDYQGLVIKRKLT